MPGLPRLIGSDVDSGILTSAPRAHDTSPDEKRSSSADRDPVLRRSRTEEAAGERQDSARNDRLGSSRVRQARREDEGE